MNSISVAPELFLFRNFVLIILHSSWGDTFWIFLEPFFCLRLCPTKMFEQCQYCIRVPLMMMIFLLKRSDLKSKRYICICVYKHNRIISIFRKYQNENSLSLLLNHWFWKFLKSKLGQALQTLNKRFSKAANIRLNTILMWQRQFCHLVEYHLVYLRAFEEV